MSSELVAIKDLAAHLGCTTQRISQLIKSGRLSQCVVVSGRRKYVTSLKAAAAEIEASSHSRQAPKPRPAAKPTAATRKKPPVRERPIGDEFDDMSRAEAERRKSVEGARLARVKREQAELAAQVERGQYIEIEAASAQLAEFMTGLIATLEGVPARLAQARPELTAEQLDAVGKEIDKARREAALVMGP